MLQDTLVISVWFVFASDYENRKFLFLCNAFYIINNREFFICKFVNDITWREKKGEGVGLLWLKARKLLSFVYMKCIAQLKQAQWNYSIFDVVRHW